MDTIGEDDRHHDDGPWARFRENATGIASLLVTGLWLGGLLADQSWWLPVLVVGYAAVVPVVAILFGDEDDRREWVGDAADTDESVTKSDAETAAEPASDTRDALETLRERYAAGEVTDEQFERKLERLLDTETLEDAEEWTRARKGDRDRDGTREPEFER
ncbi:SHOCT domain-containing protein [Natrinema sp. LN54]|uniref:SHOCT domain-containing protein n=1 Tax=Natrinema sp. LN54 TaxID=3458705 RepID=UPI004035DD5A